MKLSHPSLSLHAIIISSHRVQHTPSTASPQDRQSPAPSQFLISRRMLYSTLYIPTIRSYPMNRVSAAVTPPSKLTTSKYFFWLTRSRPPSASSNTIDHSLQVHLSVYSISASKCISELSWSGPQSASLSSLDLGLQLHLQTGWITASHGISKLTRSSRSQLVLAMVPDRHFGSESGSKPNRCQISGPGCQ